MSNAHVCKTFIRLGLVLALLISLSACATVPGTGRSQLSLVDDKNLALAASSQYKSMIQKSTLSKDRKKTASVKRVGKKVSQAAETYLKNHGMAADIPNYNWEFNLIESSQVNAFCMPGGKVAFYTGILPYCQNETGIAVIMGHEVAHAIAKHSREQASQEAATQVGGALLALGMAIGGVDAGTAQTATEVYEVSSDLGFLRPYSRTHESEADRIGLSLMAMAGYDPREAVKFWERMSEAPGSSGPNFLSTHPTDKKRIADIKKHLPEAMALYQAKSKSK